MIPFDVTSTRGKEIMGAMPPYYAEAYIFKKIAQAEGEEFDDYREAISSILDQFYVRTATWGLDTWEDELGLPTDTTLTDDERRDRIVSKIRGQGTCTIFLVKNVSAAYEKGTVEAIEDFAAYTIIVKFIDTTGIPTNLDNLKTALREIIPANLEILYELRYILISEMQNFTIGQIQQQKISNFAFNTGGDE
jgi:uncharacterized protein YmfQ (DUF2313 family)